MDDLMDSMIFEDSSRGDWHDCYKKLASDVKFISDVKPWEELRRSALNSNAWQKKFFSF